MCTDSWMTICTGITTHSVGPFMWLVAKMCGKWKLRLSLFITDAVCCCSLPFFFLEVSPKQYKVTWGKIKASLFHSWVIVTDGHVRPAKTNSSSDKHHRFEKRRKIFARFSSQNWLWRESSLLLQVLQVLAPQKEGQWNTTDGRKVTSIEG